MTLILRRKFDLFLLFNKIYRDDSEKQEGYDVVAHERLTEPRVTME